MRPLVPWLIGIIVVALLAMPVLWWVARRRVRRELRQLREDLHGLLARGARDGRLALAERGRSTADVAADVNRALDQVRSVSLESNEAETWFTALTEALPELGLVHTQTILYANPAAADLFGVDSESLCGKQVADLVRPAYRTLLRKYVGECLRGAGVTEPLEVQLIDGDAGLWVELHSRRVTWHGETALVTVARNVGYRKTLEASVGRSKLEGRVTLEAVGEGILTTDAAGVIDYMNEAAEQLIGTTRSLAVGKRFHELVAVVHESDRQSLGDMVAQCLAERRRVSPGRHALVVARQSAREFPSDVTASPIRGPDGRVNGCVVVLHDVTEIRGLTREMSYQASHDALTGLVNRKELERRLEASVKSVRGESVGHVVAYLDLDRFKLVNDTCGHVAGDNLLREIGAILREKVRDSDTVARVGGDEFVMLLVGCPLDKARQIADDTCRAVADYHFSWQDYSFDIGVSIGLVEIGHESASAEAVLNAADSACYVAKQRGRGGVHVYSARDELLARERGEVYWLQRLQHALRESQFELHLQPIIAVGGRGTDGPAGEVLLRMRDDPGQSILPSEFMGAAERYQLMSHIDRWVVQATLAAIAGGALRLPEGRTCSINLSNQTLGDEDFLQYVVEAFDYTGVDPAKLCFEVRESAVAGNVEHAQRFISVLHGIGCRVALDNFGSGMGSFANLKSLAFDYLKIDGMYTRNLAEDSVNREMVSAMVKLARTLDFRVVAEQIEDQASFEAVRALGVDFIQGFAVDPPRPIASR